MAHVIAHALVHNNEKYVKCVKAQKNVDFEKICRFYSEVISMYPKSLEPYFEFICISFFYLYKSVQVLFLYTLGVGKNGPIIKIKIRFMLVKMSTTTKKSQDKI